MGLAARWLGVGFLLSGIMTYAGMGQAGQPVPPSPAPVPPQRREVGVFFHGLLARLWEAYSRESS